MGDYRPITEFSHNGVPLTVILKDHEKWVKKREGKKADLIGADLKNAKLRGVYLRGAELIKANLSECDLREANLSEANLFGANLTGSKIFGANLRRANLEKANLSEATLSMCDLTEANLKIAFLSWAKMIRANLTEADLSEAYMRGVDLTSADLSKAVMRGVQMVGANLSESRMGGAVLDESNLNEVYLREADLSFGSLRKSNLQEANLEKVNLNSADLTNADLLSANLIGADLTGAFLSGVRLHNTKCTGWILKDVTCTHIHRGRGREIARFNPGEFERKYARRQNVCEIILQVPLTSSGYYIGKFIARSINHIKGDEIIELNGIEVLTNEDTKFSFNCSDHEFFESQKEPIEIGLRVALNKYFRDQAIEKNQTYFGDIEGNPKGDLYRREGNDPEEFKPWAVDHEKMKEKLVEHYARLERMGDTIYKLISDIITKG